MNLSYIENIEDDKNKYGIIIGHGILIEDELIMIKDNIQLLTVDKLGYTLSESKLLGLYSSTKQNRRDLLLNRNHSHLKMEKIYEYRPHIYTKNDLFYNMSINMETIHPSDSDTSTYIEKYKSSTKIQQYIKKKIY